MGSALVHLAHVESSGVTKLTAPRVLRTESSGILPRCCRSTILDSGVSRDFFNPQMFQTQRVILVKLDLMTLYDEDNLMAMGTYLDRHFYMLGVGPPVTIEVTYGQPVLVLWPLT